jgi:hypothetical protein
MLQCNTSLRSTSRRESNCSAKHCCTLSKGVRRCSTWRAFQVYARQAKDSELAHIGRRDTAARQEMALGTEPALD